MDPLALLRDLIANQANALPARIDLPLSEMVAGVDDPDFALHDALANSLSEARPVFSVSSPSGRVGYRWSVATLSLDGGIEAVIARPDETSGAEISVVGMAAIGDIDGLRSVIHAAIRHEWGEQLGLTERISIDGTILTRSLTAKWYRELIETLPGQWTELSIFISANGWGSEADSAHRDAGRDRMLSTYIEHALEIMGSD